MAAPESRSELRGLRRSHSPTPAKAAQGERLPRQVRERALARVEAPVFLKQVQPVLAPPLALTVWTRARACPKEHWRYLRALFVRPHHLGPRPCCTRLLLRSGPLANLLLFHSNTQD